MRNKKRIITESDRQVDLEKRQQAIIEAFGQGMDTMEVKGLKIYNIGDDGTVNFSHYPHNEEEYMSYEEFTQVYPEEMRNFTAKQDEDPMYEGNYGDPNWDPTSREEEEEYVAPMPKVGDSDAINRGADAISQFNDDERAEKYAGIEEDGESWNMDAAHRDTYSDTSHEDNWDDNQQEQDEFIVYVNKGGEMIEYSRYGYEEEAAGEVEKLASIGVEARY